MTRRLAAVALTALCMLSLVAAGCGDDAREAVDSVTAEAGAALEDIRRELSADLDRAQARIDDLAADATAGSAAAIESARVRANRALEQAREQADEAIADAEAAGDRIEEQLDQLRADADRRVDELRDRIDQELPASP